MSNDLPEIPAWDAPPQVWRDFRQQAFDHMPPEMRLMGGGLDMVYQPPGERHRHVVLLEYAGPDRWLVCNEFGETYVVDSRWLSNPRP